MKNIRFLSLRAAIEALAMMGIRTQADLAAMGLQLKEVGNGK
ncbi:hypothetical protein [Metapseudomonas otitidis]|nr:hypothetical protein [Pseudomonas otitidis]